MHEMGIADSILEAVRTEARRHPQARIVKVGVRVGELSGVQHDSLSFCFESLVNGSDLEPLALEIEVSPQRNHCPACDEVFRVVDFNPACPCCGSLATLPAGGDELELAYLEVEEHEPH